MLPPPIIQSPGKARARFRSKVDKKSSLWIQYYPSVLRPNKPVYHTLKSRPKRRHIQSTITTPTDGTRRPSRGRYSKWKSEAAAFFINAACSFFFDYVATISTCCESTKTGYNQHGERSVIPVLPALEPCLVSTDLCTPILHPSSKSLP